MIDFAGSGIVHMVALCHVVCERERDRFLGEREKGSGIAFCDSCTSCTSCPCDLICVLLGLLAPAFLLVPPSSLSLPRRWEAFQG